MLVCECVSARGVGVCWGESTVRVERQARPEGSRGCAAAIVWEELLLPPPPVLLQRLPDHLRPWKGGERSRKGSEKAVERQ